MNARRRRVDPAPNAFVGNSPADTVHNVSVTLEYLSQLSIEDSGVGMDGNREFARFLIMQTLHLALEAAKEQMRVEREARKEAQPS